MWKPLAPARQSLIGGSLTLLLSKLALAQPLAPTTPRSEPPFSLSVERDVAAVSCPDTSWFETRVESHAGKAGQAGIFKVQLGKRGDAWLARIQRWEETDSAPAAERVLQDRSTACQPLAEAAALTIAILADDFAQRVEPAPPVLVSAPERKVPVAVAPPDVTEPRRESRTKVWVGAGGGGAVSFISPLAPMLGFSLAADTEHVHTGLRVMMTTEQKFALDPGSVVVQAWLLTLFSCLRLARGSLGAALCGVADASMLRASAEGFDDGRPSSRAYGALGLELHPSWNVSNSYRLSAALGALVPFSRESFSVVGRGAAYEPPAVSWRFLLFSEIGAF